MTRVRVLVVDDAVVVRKIVTDALAEDPTIEVVGTAPNGRIALAKIPQVNPDVVTLDVEMPEMDGLATLSAIRAQYPRLPVIMFSTLTERGAATTMEALLRGANDYVTKPANVGSVAEAQQRVKAELLPRVHALSGKRPVVIPPPAAAPRARLSPALRATGRTTTPTRVDAVVVGVSTGGPNALAALLPQLPADLPVPVLIVQHMPPMFTRLLADRLDATCALRVREAGDRQPVIPGQVLIAPGNRHLTVQRVGTEVRTALNEGPPENSCRPAVDVLFRTAAGVYGPNTLGLVLTGMGADGRNGSEHIVAAGGRVLAQDEASSVVWGMPGAVAAAGVADEILPLQELAGAIRRRTAVGRCAPEAGRVATDRRPPTPLAAFGGRR
ncbi:protein-glutamate methylesterase/protein-glutamine glutaminase [Egicoccus halophilus]|uniref:Protein-glutamate methylesterase/protein-glutamine glutaminase n=1 Tax=Egicoccus halophilus TaxID=1670830 RepID=A0A8J3AA15_9ACTN|nr:chemotaxis response regulator protein-glutamate methylesterase [Egicoccus halophilus]GGI08128.1 chemotaxis response regulator protein-glutamate methylesterase [Egicoccus halophilus]